MKKLRFLILFATGVLVLSACDSNGVPAEPFISLRLAIENGSAIQTGVSGKSTALIDISSAKVLIKTVQFHYEDSTTYEFKTGPFAVTLDPAAGSETDIAVGSIPEGVVKRVTFKIHKPEDTEPIPDPDFREGTSGQLRYSMLIQGTMDASPFTLKIRKTMDQRIEFTPHIDIAAGEELVVQLRTDASLWFTAKDGGSLDPTDDALNEEISNAIKDSFRELSIR